MRYINQDFFQEITEAIKRNRSRSLLTGFGVFWGIFMLLLLMGGGDGMKRAITGEVKDFATNSGVIAAAPTSKPYKGFESGRNWSLDLNDMERIKKSVPGVKVVAPMVSVMSNSVTFKEKKTDCNCHGCLPLYTKIMTPKMKYGRYINEQDVRQDRKVCVIGKKIYKDLFEEGSDPCGEFISVDGVNYKVIGVDCSTSAISFDGKSEETVTIPITVAQKIYNRGNVVDMICITAQDGAKIKDLLERVKTTIFRAHYIDPDDNQALISVNMEMIFSIIANLLKGVNFLIWIIGLGTIFAAAIGVSNIMMVAVKERTTEIGIRRAIGATPNMITFQIIMESILLTTISGFIGIVTSVGILAVIDMANPDDSFQVSFGSAMIVLCILLTLGVLAGLAPARRAMEIKPVDAMRED